MPPVHATGISISTIMVASQFRTAEYTRNPITKSVMGRMTFSRSVASLSSLISPDQIRLVSGGRAA